MSVARDFYSRDSKTPSLVHVFALESRFQVLRHISRLQARGTPRGRAEGSRGRPRVGERQKSECGRHEREHVAVLGRGRGHNGRVEGHVRRRWALACVDARADARQLDPLARCPAPPSRTAIAAPSFLYRGSRGRRALISVFGGRLRVFSPRTSLFAPPRLSPWRPSPPLALPARGTPSLGAFLRREKRNLEISKFSSVTLPHGKLNVSAS